MSEKPILFSGPMVRAILEGQKTQTRRVVKIDRYGCACRAGRGLKIGADGPVWRPYGGSPEVPAPQDVVNEFCPYGKPGDRLWVRETWRPYSWTEDGGPWTFQFAADMATRRERAQAIVGDKYEEWDQRIWQQVSEECDAAHLDIDDEGNYIRNPDETPPKWRPSIHMPRWASRIDLLVKDVRVERLQEISEADALAEGIGQFGHAEKWSALAALAGIMAANPQISRRGLLTAALSAFHLAVNKDGKAEACTATGAFAHLWDSINAAKHPWGSNPWVWVVEFERVA